MGYRPDNPAGDALGQVLGRLQAVVQHPPLSTWGEFSMTTHGDCWVTRDTGTTGDRAARPRRAGWDGRLGGSVRQLGTPN